MDLNTISSIKNSNFSPVSPLSLEHGKTEVAPSASPNTSRAEEIAPSEGTSHLLQEVINDILMNCSSNQVLNYDLLQVNPSVLNAEILVEKLKTELLPLGEPAKVHDLNLSLCQVDEEILKALAQIYPEVRSINLANALQLQDHHLIQLQQFKNLSHLDIQGCFQVTNQGLAYLTAINQLISLNLAGCISITDEGLMHLRSLTQLTSLNLAGCSYITDKGLTYLQGLTQLASLNLANCTYITDEGLTYLQGLTQLASLNLANCHDITDEGLGYLKTLTTLTDLDLSGCTSIMDIGDAVDYLQSFVNLISLNLKDCRYFWDKDLTVLLEKLPNLKELKISSKLPSMIGAEEILTLKRSFPEVTINELSTESVNKRQRVESGMQDNSWMINDQTGKYGFDNN